MVVPIQWIIAPHVKNLVRTLMLGDFSPLMDPLEKEEEQNLHGQLDRTVDEGDNKRRKIVSGRGRGGGRSGGGRGSHSGWGGRRRKLRDCGVAVHKARCTDEPASDALVCGWTFPFMVSFNLFINSMLYFSCMQMGGQGC